MPDPVQKKPAVKAAIPLPKPKPVEKKAEQQPAGAAGKKGEGDTRTGSGAKPVDPLEAAIRGAQNPAAAAGDKFNELMAKKNVGRGQRDDKSGDSDVHTTQEALKETGHYQGEVDGKFGPQTQEAVKKFQKENGLKEDGIVGPKTKAKMQEKLKEKAEKAAGEKAEAAKQAEEKAKASEAKTSETAKELEKTKGPAEQAENEAKALEEKAKPYTEAMAGLEKAQKEFDGAVSDYHKAQDATKAAQAKAKQTGDPKDKQAAADAKKAEEAAYAKIAPLSHALTSAQTKMNGRPAQEAKKAAEQVPAAREKAAKAAAAHKVNQDAHVEATMKAVQDRAAADQARLEAEQAKV
jgi:peptidoglycan hydrolase-like protein with peptidoglycan-binding domain